MIVWPAHAQVVNELRGPFEPDAVARVIAEGPVERGAGSPEDDPFAPLGLRIGTFDVNATLDLGITGLRTRDTVASSSPPPAFSDEITTGVVGEAAVDLRARSDWSRHAAEFGMTGAFPLPLTGEDDVNPSLDLDAALRLDLGLDTTLTGTADYAFGRDDPSSAAVLAATDPILFPGITADDDVNLHRFGAALGIARQVGPVIGELEINVAREINGAAQLSDGSVVAQDDLDFTRFGGRLRGVLATGAVVSPFVEAEVSQRIMDARPDSAGVDRNALLYAARIGLAVDRGEKLSGEIAVGYVYEDIADPALADIGGVSLLGALNWSPMRGTDVALGLSTTTQSGGTNDISGSINYDASLGVVHRARANLEFNGDLGLSYEDVTGNADDTLTLSGSIGATWWFNRLIGLTGRIGHERILSDDPSERSETNSGFIGIRLQR